MTKRNLLKTIWVKNLSGGGKSQCKGPEARTSLALLGKRKISEVGIYAERVGL